MWKLEKHLEEAGYKPINLDYSFTQTINQIAAEQVAEAVAKCRADGNAQKIHFVTHSLGGIVVRHYLQDNKLPSGSRLVMIAPPNQGSELADRLNTLPVSRLVPVPAWKELGTESGSVPNQLQPLDIEFGIIAGNRSVNPLLSKLIPGPDDGKVAVKRAKLHEMADFLVVSSSHTFLMLNREVIRQASFFLEHGTFDRDAEVSTPPINTGQSGKNL